ncbi:uncharacterized protein LOC141878992 isoform X3 [Acropora palmata]|uniref:uncharacterized protein LOC141878992 isoform X3 n=1 Tax=Acropora palmata TaxID=6131 RepID=UPI003DA10C46
MGRSVRHASIMMLPLILLLAVLHGSKQCPTKCKCRPFGKNLRVNCEGIDQVPKGIPPNTLTLNLAGNSLKGIREGAFETLPLLAKFLLSSNDIKGSFHLPSNVTTLLLRGNAFSLADLKIILRGLKRLVHLDIEDNRMIGPDFTADVFVDLGNIVDLSMGNCDLENIESGTFSRMHNLSRLSLSGNKLSHIQRGMFHGIGSNLYELYLSSNQIVSVDDGTFVQLGPLGKLDLADNSLSSAPDLTGLNSSAYILLDHNQITDLRPLGKSGNMEFMGLKLGNNRIEYIPPDLFQKITIKGWLDLSLNKLRSIPQNLFFRSSHLSFLGLSSNYISKIDNESFAGLKTLQTLMMAKNNLTFLANDTFQGITLQALLLHSNAIMKIDVRAFAGLHELKSLTLFDNLLTSLPDGIFNDITSKTRVSITCNQLKRLPLGTYNSVIECAPSTTFHLTIRDATENFVPHAFADTGFGCRNVKDVYSCTLCPAGSFNQKLSCFNCSAGGFYQDKMGQAECKKCSPGTYVSVDRQPGSAASDCRACPYGTLSNETAGYRACKCLHGFYRMDRFGPCTPCPAHGLFCVNDTAVLAPNYYWKWINKSHKDLYRKFSANIHYFKPDYNVQFSRFPFLLPQPLRCPLAGSCKGGIDSECHERYQGTLCASCKNGFYFRFNSCLKCPSLANSIISSLLVVALFVLVFLMVLWGDSKKAENNRTVADVIMSCFKIVIGFYQVIAGIFSALTRVRWPVTLISMEKYLKLMEGNIFQFAPLSCIHSRLRMDPFSIFLVTLAVNSLVISLIFIYLLLKRRHIKKRRNLTGREKLSAESCLKRSCYRNIFLFLMASYPVTSKIIIQILPLPGACVQQCFTDERSNCISLLKADYSIRCFTTRHKVYWPIGATFALYPVAFPLLILVLLYKFRNSQDDKEVAFGLRVFFENYKKEFWFWEVPEMYRKLILISLINLLESESSSQIAVTMLTVSAFGIAYTFFRPMKEKFEDRLHTFVLWVIFFDVCLGGVYTTFEATHEQKENDSLFVNIIFVVLNSFVLLVALGKGIAHCKFVWVTVSACLMQGLHVIWQGIRSLKMKILRWFKDLWLSSSDKPDEKALWISNTTYGSLH